MAEPTNKQLAAAIESLAKQMNYALRTLQSRFDGISGMESSGDADTSGIRRQLNSIALTVEKIGNGLNTSQKLVDALDKGCLKIDDIEGKTGSFQYLSADSLDAKYMKADVIEAETGAYHYLHADSLDTNYIRADRANINEAWIKDLMVQGKMIVQDGTVFYLDAVQVNASRITAGTLTVDRLMVRNDAGEYYLIQPDEDGKPQMVKMDGNVIGDHTIAADKLIAHSVTADQLTVNNIVGTGGWINLAKGTFAYNNAETGHGISWDDGILTINGCVFAKKINGQYVDVTSLFAQDIKATKSFQVDNGVWKLLQDAAGMSLASANGFTSFVVNNTGPQMRYDASDGGAAIYFDGEGSAGSFFSDVVIDSYSGAAHNRIIHGAAGTSFVNSDGNVYVVIYTDGSASFAGSLTLANGLTISSGGMSVTGTAAMKNALTVAGTTTLSGNATLKKALTVTGAAKLNGGASIGGNLVADHIVEIGSDDTYRYEKYASGTMRVWGAYQFSAACTTAFGSSNTGWYRTGGITPPNYPVAFAEAPVLSIDWRSEVDGYGAFVWRSDKGRTDRPPSVNVVRPGSVSSLSGYLEVIAIGRWE